jgi:hypothetical protein
MCRPTCGRKTWEFSGNFLEEKALSLDWPDGTMQMRKVLQLEEGTKPDRQAQRRQEMLDNPTAVWLECKYRLPVMIAEAEKEARIAAALQERPRIETRRSGL